MENLFGDIQLAVGQSGGAERAVHILNCALFAGAPSSTLAAADFKNAHRRAILHEAYKVEDFRPVWRLWHWLL